MLAATSRLELRSRRWTAAEVDRDDRGAGGAAGRRDRHPRSRCDGGGRRCRGTAGAGAAGAALGRRSRRSVAWMERSGIRAPVRRHEGPRITRKRAASRLHRRYLAYWLRYRNEIARGFPGGLNRLFSCWGGNRGEMDACGRSRCCSAGDCPRGHRRIRARSGWRTCGGRTSRRRAAFSAPAGAGQATRRLRGSASQVESGGRSVMRQNGAQVAGSRRRGGGQFPGVRLVVDDLREEAAAGPGGLSNT